MPLLQLAAVSLAYGHVPLLDHADLVIEDGERIGLIGRNGAGKSSLLRLVTGEATADDGTVWRTPALRVGAVAQEPAFAPGATIEAAVAAPLRAAADPEEGWQVSHRVATLLSRFGLPGAAEIASLSGGQKKRVALAAALAAQPQLLVLDEPTNHLDMDTKAMLVRVLRDFDGTLLFVSHDRKFLSALSNRVLELTADGAHTYGGGYDEYVAQSGHEAPGLRS